MKVLSKQRKCRRDFFVVLLPEGTAEAPVLAQVFEQSSPPATKLLPKHCFMKQSEA